MSVQDTATDLSRFSGMSVYENVNPEIVALYEGEAMVLDVGCGSGALGARLKTINPFARVHGMDLSPDAGLLAMNRLDRFTRIDLDREPLPDRGDRYNLIILGDILEHLKRPDALLLSLRDILAPGGSVILSVPNVANFGVRWRLALGRFDYADSGIMDRSHLRFFTYGTIEKLVDDCSFRITARRVISRFPPVISRLFYRLVAVQFILKLSKQ